MPLVVAERRQTAAWPANPAPQPWQTQLIQAPALAPSRPHTHTWTHTHRSMCKHVCIPYCHKHMINPVFSLALPRSYSFILSFRPHHIFSPQSHSSSFNPSVITSLLSHSFTSILCLPPYFSLPPAFKHSLLFPLDLLPYFLLLVFASLLKRLSSSSPLGTQQAWPWCLTPHGGSLPGALSAHTHKHTPTHTSVDGTKSQCKAGRRWSCLKP